MRRSGAALCVLLAGCAGTVEGRLEHAGERGQVPSDLEVVYDDHDRQWGGERITLRGDGTLEIERWRPGQPEDEPPLVRQAQLAAEEVLAVVRLLVELDAWEQRVEEENGRVDERKATLTVRTGGASERVWEWASDLELTDRVVRVKQRLLRLAGGTAR
jgi:hypothetical protein